MTQLPLVLQAYQPRLPLGDWQLVIYVNRERNIVAVERWPSSERIVERNDPGDTVIWLETGIRAFRQQMPALAEALQCVSLAGLSDAEIVRTIFQALTAVYAAAPSATDLPEEGISGEECASFMEDRLQRALAHLKRSRH